MNSFKLLFLILFVYSNLLNGQIVMVDPPNMLELSKTNLDRNYVENTEARITVSSHYVAEYLESNFQYNKYLEFLIENNLELEYKEALPDKNIWNLVNLDSETSIYLKENYWENELFSDYPILGLNFDQVNKYLKWKTNVINVACLEMKGIKLDGRLNESNILKEIKKSKIGVVSMRLPTSQESVSMFVQAASKKVKRIRTSNPNFENWLQTHNKYSYLNYQPNKKLERNNAVKEKLKSFGINSVIKSKISTLSKSVNNNVFELVMDNPNSLKIGTSWNENRTKDDILSINVVYENRSISDIRTIIGETPLLGFRINCTNVNHNENKMNTL